MAEVSPQRARQLALQARGQCTQCGQRKARAKRLLCALCAGKANARGSAHYKKLIDFYRAHGGK